MRLSLRCQICRRFNFVARLLFHHTFFPLIWTEGGSIALTYQNNLQLKQIEMEPCIAQTLGNKVGFLSSVKRPQGYRQPPLSADQPSWDSRPRGEAKFLPISICCVAMCVCLCKILIPCGVPGWLGRNVPAACSGPVDLLVFSTLFTRYSGKAQVGWVVPFPFFPLDIYEPMFLS